MSFLPNKAGWQCLKVQLLAIIILFKISENLECHRATRNLLCLTAHYMSGSRNARDNVMSRTSQHLTRCILKIWVWFRILEKGGGNVPTVFCGSCATPLGVLWTIAWKAPLTLCINLCQLNPQKCLCAFLSYGQQTLKHLKENSVKAQMQHKKLKNNLHYGFIHSLNLISSQFCLCEYLFCCVLEGKWLWFCWPL